MAIEISKEIEVHWGDMDAPWECRDYSPSVVNINCNFRHEIRFPATLLVELDATLASEKRVVHQYRITDRDEPDILYADAEATVVWVDPATRRSIPVPEPIRKLFKE